VVLGLNWGIHGYRPATGHLSHDTGDYNYLSPKFAEKLMKRNAVRSFEHNNSFIQYQFNNVFRPNGPSSG
jgi:hypothetical protein